MGFGWPFSGLLGNSVIVSLIHAAPNAMNDDEFSLVMIAHPLMLNLGSRHP